MIKTVTDNSLLNEFNPNWDKKSWITNYSTCIWLRKITIIISEIITNIEERNRCINILKANLQLLFTYRINDIEQYRQIFIQYTNKYLNGNTLEPIELFISDYSSNKIKEYFNVYYRSDKNEQIQNDNKDSGNIFIDFNANKFITKTGIIEDIFFYENYYRHFFFMAFILESMELSGIKISMYEKNIDFYKIFFYIFYENINSTILTGISALAEYELNYPYIALYDELRQLVPANKNTLVFNASPKNKSLDIRIKEWSFIAALLAEYRGVRTEKDVGSIIRSSLGNQKITMKDIGVYVNRDSFKDNDKKADSKIRIIEGSNPYRMSVFVDLSGRRIINRLFNADGDVRRNIKAHNVVDYQYFWADTLVVFLLWCIIKNSEQYENDFNDFKEFKFYTYGKFIENFIEDNKNHRNIILKTAIPLVLFDKTVDEQEKFINSHFTKEQTRQKALIRSTIKLITGIDKSISNRAIPLTKSLLREIWHVYNR